MRRTVTVTTDVSCDEENLESMCEAADIEKSTAIAHILEGAEFPVTIDGVRFMFSTYGVEDDG